MFTGADFFQLFVAAVFVGIAIYLLALGFRDVDLSVVAPFRYSYLLTSAIGGFLVFREVPDVWTVVGAGSDRGQRHLYAASRGGAPPLAHRHGDAGGLIAAKATGGELGHSTKFQLTAPLTTD